MLNHLLYSKFGSCWRRIFSSDTHCDNDYTNTGNYFALDFSENASFIFIHCSLKQQFSFHQFFILEACIHSSGLSLKRPCRMSFIVYIVYTLIQTNLVRPKLVLPYGLRSTYVRGYHKNFRYLILEKNIEIFSVLDFSILGYVIFEFLYLIWYVSRLWVPLSKMAEDLGPQY